MLLFSILFMAFILLLLYSMQTTLKIEPIVLTSYNNENEIEGRLRTICNNHPSSPVIVVDLGSTDDTTQIIEQLTVYYPNISIVYK